MIRISSSGTNLAVSSLGSVIVASGRYAVGIGRIGVCVGKDGSLSTELSDWMSDISSDRQLAYLTVGAIEWAAVVADVVVETHDLIVGKTWREAEKTETPKLTLRNSPMRKRCTHSQNLGLHCWRLGLMALTLMPPFLNSQVGLAWKVRSLNRRNRPAHSPPIPRPSFNRAIDGSGDMRRARCATYRSRPPLSVPRSCKRHIVCQGKLSQRAAQLDSCVKH